LYARFFNVEKTPIRIAMRDCHLGESESRRIRIEIVHGAATPHT